MALPQKSETLPLTESRESQLVTRILEKGETDLFKKITELHNRYWPKELGITHDIPSQWAQNGLVFAAFQDKNLIATLACNRMSSDQFESATTYRNATDENTLNNFNDRGSILVPFAVTVSTTKIPEPPRLLSDPLEIMLHGIAEILIDNYAYSHRDYVLRFHEDPKGGLSHGAHVGKILPYSRLEDYNAMGFNITMEYQKLSPGMVIRHTEPFKPARFVIEEVMMYAVNHGISHIIAFSRPGGFRNYLLEIHQG